jgi:hypothetical protein
MAAARHASFQMYYLLFQKAMSDIFAACFGLINMEKKCSKCQEIFTCQNEASGCWCENVPLTTETLDYLKAHFDNCLCSKCLDEYSIDQSNTINETNN